MVTIDIIPIMVERIVDEFHPLRVILFGSQARGEGTRWSDVAPLVVLDACRDSRRATAAIHDSLGDLLVSKDIVVTTPEEILRAGDLAGTVLRSALREGKVLYERG